MSDEVLKRRLIGAAVVLLGAWVITWFLPEPGARSQAEEGVQVVTLPVEDPATPPVPPEAVETPAPPIIAAPQTAAVPPPDVSLEPGPEPEPEPSPPPKAEPKPEVTGPELTLDSKLSTAPVAQSPAVPAPEKPAPLPPARPAPKPVEPTPAPAAPVPAPATTPPAAPAAPRAKTWTVQVGSFSNIDNARELQAKLKAAGIDSILSPAETGKGTLYRVRAGSHLEREAAKALQQKVQQLGHPQATLTEE